MLTCVIRYRSDATKKRRFIASARRRRQAIPRCGAGPAAYAAYRERLAADPAGRANYASGQRETSIPRKRRTFLTLAPAPHGDAA